MQAGYSEIEFLRRRSGTVSSLISKFASGVQPSTDRLGDIKYGNRRENRRHTVVGVAVPPSSCSSGRNRSNSGAFLANALERRSSQSSFSSTSSSPLSSLTSIPTMTSSTSVTLQEMTNNCSTMSPRSIPLISSQSVSKLSHNNSSAMHKQTIMNEIITPNYTSFTARKPLTFKTERKIKDSTIADLKRRTDQRKADLNRVQSMPNGGTSGAAAAREKFLRKIGEDPNKKHKIQRSNTFSSGGGTGVKSLLLKWCQVRVKEYPIEVNNYSGSWADGSAFCALIHSFFPDAYSWDVVFVSTDNENERRRNFNLAFDTALEKADADPLIEVEDMIFMGNRPDAKCIFCYLQSLYNKLRKFEKPVEKKAEVDEVDI